MSELIELHGGLAAFLLAVVLAFNIAISCVSKILETLKIKVPGFFGKVAGVLQKLLDFIGANPEHKK